MDRVISFYNRYHLKNREFTAVIGEGNFTYWYILGILHQACTTGFANLKVLDVGCGVGAISLYLASQGATVTGVDISSRAIEIAQQAKKSVNLKNVTFIQGEVEKGRGDYDLVTCFEVIEHIPDEKAFLKKIHSQLQSQGSLILSTPSSQNWLYKLGFYQGFDTEVGHLRRYSVIGLTGLLAAQGFKVIRVREVEGPLRNLLYTTKLGFIIKFVKGPLVPLFHVFDWVSGKVFGFSDIQVIAQKV